MRERFRSHVVEIAARQDGMSNLEKLGIALIIVSIVSFIPPARGLMGDAYDGLFKRYDDNGHLTHFSIATRGILIILVAVGAFIGAGCLLLYTNLGGRLAFLITGAAVFGWLLIGSLLFVVYAPRGLRPAVLTGLNAFQIRIPALAAMLGAAILFSMFVAALDRYERADED
jgi:hypothetical protein